jgi:hypothetical protein
MSPDVRQLEVVYCDDVRVETSGKRILIGVYTATMYVPQFPATLPKFCVILSYLGSADTPPEKLRFLVFRDGELLAEQALPDGAARKLLNDADGLDAPLIRAMMQMEFSPFELTGPCTLRVRAEVDGIELRSSALRVRAMAPVSSGGRD